MEFIKNKQKLSELTNELISDCGEPKEIASQIEEMIFDYLGRFLESGDCGCSAIANMIYTLKRVKDLFLNIE